MPETESDWKALVFVPGSRPATAPPVQEEAVQLHSIRSFLFGRVEDADPASMRDQWQRTLDLVMDLGSSLSRKDKAWEVGEIEIGLTLSAKGELLFIAEAGAEASVKIKLVRK